MAELAVLVSKWDVQNRFTFFHAWFIIIYFNNFFSGITKEKTHLCDKCDQKFEYPSYLKNHIDTVHHGFYNVKSKNHSDFAFPKLMLHNQSHAFLYCVCCGIFSLPYCRYTIVFWLYGKSEIGNIVQFTLSC